MSPRAAAKTRHKAAQKQSIEKNLKQDVLFYFFHTSKINYFDEQNKMNYE